MITLKFKVTFYEGLLGTAPNDKDVYRNFIASKAPDAKPIEDEIAAVGVDEVAEKGMTVFHRDENGNPVLMDYHIKGFFKDACGMLSRLSVKNDKGKKTARNESGKLTAYKKEIDGLIFVEPRMIPIQTNGAEIGICQRPLRAQTAQGERVALAMSEEAPAGSTIEFSVGCLNDAHAAAVREWMKYGILRGIGQWRNSGKGRFLFEELGEETTPEPWSE